MDVYTEDRHFSGVTFFRGWVIFLKSRIDIFAVEKPILGLYGMKIYTECNSFLNRGHDIFVD